MLSCGLERSNLLMTRCHKYSSFVSLFWIKKVVSEIENGEVGS